MNSQDTSNEQPRHNQGTLEEHATKRQRRKTSEEHEIVAEPRHIQGTSNSCGTQAHPRSYPRHRHWLKVLIEGPNPNLPSSEASLIILGMGSPCNLRAISSGLTGFPLPLAWSTHRWLDFYLAAIAYSSITGQVICDPLQFHRTGMLQMEIPAAWNTATTPTVIEYILDVI